MGAKRFEEQITVGAGADKVFDYVSNFARHGEWAGHGLTVTKTSEERIAMPRKR